MDQPLKDHLWFLAIRYSSPSPPQLKADLTPSEIVAANYYDGICAMNTIIQQGWKAICTPLMLHEVAKLSNLSTEYWAWQSLNDDLISRCDGLMVLATPGWIISRGVTHEVCVALWLRKPIRFIDAQGSILEEFLPR